jgi:hypothetical protein
MSHHFNKLPVSDESEEIRDLKQLRNMKKKLSKKEKQSPTTERLAEINKIRILIREYEYKDKPPTIRKKKKKKEPKKADDFDLNEIKKFNKQREREVREGNERKRKEKEKREEESAKYWKNYKKTYQKGEHHYYYRQQWGTHSEHDPEMMVENKITIRGLLETLKLVKKELPDDIREIIDNFDKSKWKKLCMKYHPDKYKGEENYGILLNGIKDHYEPKEIKYDETWTKEP